MKIWTCDKFTPAWPGRDTAAVVYAESRKAAACLLNIELRALELPGDAKEEDMIAFPKNDKAPEARILSEGDC